MLYNTGSSTQCSVMNKRDEREGRERGDISIHIVIPSVVQQKLAQHYKAIIFKKKIRRTSKKKTKPQIKGKPFSHRTLTPF